MEDLLHCYQTPCNLYQWGSKRVKYNCTETFFPLFNYPPLQKRHLDNYAYFPNTLKISTNKIII